MERCIRKQQLDQMHCEDNSCDAPVTHVESWDMAGNRFRFWCERHVPMSGHYESCSKHECGVLLQLYLVHRDALLERGDREALFFCTYCRTARGTTVTSRGCRCGSSSPPTRHLRDESLDAG